MEDKWHWKTFFITFAVGMHIIYYVYFAIVFMKWAPINHTIVQVFYNINIAIQYVICLYLIYRFFPYHASKLTPINKNDRVIIFWSAWIMAFNLGVLQIIEKLPIISTVFNTYDAYTKNTGISLIPPGSM